MAITQAVGWRKAFRAIVGSICIDQSAQKAQVITIEKCRVSGPLKLIVKENDSLMALYQKLNRNWALSISSSPPHPPGRVHRQTVVLQSPFLLGFVSSPTRNAASPSPPKDIITRF